MKSSGLSWRGAWVPVTFGIFLTGLLVLLGGSRVAAQDPQGRYIASAGKRLTSLIDVSNGEGYVLESNKFSIGGGWLKKSKEWTRLFSLTLNAGTKYRFLAAGDVDAQDVDVRVTNLKGDKVFKADTANDPQAKVDFTPDVTGQYVVEIRLYASKNGEDCVCLATVMVSKKK